MSTDSKLTKPKRDRDWFLRQQRAARRTMEQLRKIIPGAFDENGNAIVATAHFPRLPK